MADDDSAVMHGRFDEEDVFQKFAGNGSVQHRSAAHHIVQQDLPLKYDQGAGAGLGHLGAGKNGLPDHLIHHIAGLRMGKECDEAAAAHLFQQAADLRLKQDNERQDTQIHHSAHQIVNAVEFEYIRQHQSRQEHEQALEQTGCLGAPNPGQHLIEHQSHDRNIQIVRDLNRQQIPADIRGQFSESHIHFSSSSLSGHEY